VSPRNLQDSQPSYEAGVRLRCLFFPFSSKSGLKKTRLLLKIGRIWLKKEEKMEGQAEDQRKAKDGNAVPKGSQRKASRDQHLNRNTVQELRAGCVTKFKTRGCCLCGAHPIV
jgi:hypothetical protein